MEHMVLDLHEVRMSAMERIDSFHRRPEAMIVFSTGTPLCRDFSVVFRL